MEESKNNGMMKNLKYVFVLVGVVAMVLAYFLVFSGYSDEADDLDSDIDDLKGQYETLQEKAKKFNEKDVKKYVEECDAEYEKVMKRFDGGISYQSQIMDTYNMAQALDIRIPTLTLTQIADVTGEDREDVKFLTNQKYVEKMMTYQFETLTTYDKFEDVLKYILEFEGKRKVLTSVGFDYDSTTQEVSMIFSVNEYAIAGEGRKVSDVEIPAYNQGPANIFYNNEIVSRMGS